MKLSYWMLRCSSLCVLAVFSAAILSHPALAFDPDADVDNSPAPRRHASSTLPSTAALTNPSGRRNRTDAAFPQVGTANLPPINFNPTVTPPLVPLPPAPLFPPVDPATMARAQQEIGTSPAPLAPAFAPAPIPQASVSQASTGFIAPAPLIADVPVPPSTPAVINQPVPVTLTQPAPVVINPPVTSGVLAAAPVAPAPLVPTPSVVSPQPATAPTPVFAAPAAPAPEELSKKSKTILSTIPSNIGSTPSKKATKVTVSRVNPKVDSIENKDGSYESSGIKIAVRHPGIDTNAELTTAYNALSNGDGEGAIAAYKRVLAADPLNQDALFGLASIYHRQGQLDKARPLYGILLKNYPNNRDGLNNFLVLISDEAPQEALAELERLEQRNPDFSPIPAQEALLLNKLGYVVEARNKMLRAIELTPDNLTYKYNLAVMFDSQGDYKDASALYAQLIQAAANGGSLPTTVDALQKRMNFIALQATPTVKTN